MLRDGREVATVPTSSLDHRRLVNLLVGEELAVAHHEAETLQPERERLSGLDGQSGGERPALSLRGITGRLTRRLLHRLPGGQITGMRRTSPAQAARRCWVPPSGPPAGPAR